MDDNYQFISNIPLQIVWTRNASEAINLVAYSWGMANLKAGDEVCVKLKARWIKNKKKIFCNFL